MYMASEESDMQAAVHLCEPLLKQAREADAHSPEPLQVISSPLFLDGNVSCALFLDGNVSCALRETQWPNHPLLGYESDPVIKSLAFVAPALDISSGVLPLILGQPANIMLSGDTYLASAFRCWPA